MTNPATEPAITATLTSDCILPPSFSSASFSSSVSSDAPAVGFPDSELVLVELVLKVVADDDKALTERGDDDDEDDDT